MKAVELLRELNKRGARKLPDDAPRGFIRARWERHVFTSEGLGDAPSDRPLLLTAILADGINLGLTRMADACPGVSLSALSRIAAWHIRDETYAKALAEIVNHHHRLEFAAHWGAGTTSSSDGQRFKAGGSGEAIGSVNARYGNEPGATFWGKPNFACQRQGFDHSRRWTTRRCRTLRSFDGHVFPHWEPVWVL